MGTLRQEHHGRILLLTLQRPEVRNALSVELLNALLAAVSSIDTRSTSAVILTGMDPAFCAGLDLKELGAGRDLLESGGDLVRRVEALPVPLIGAVNGPAVAGGLELALACDFLIASDRARFADTHARVGVMPGWGMSANLPRVVGFPLAIQMSLTGDYLDAEGALRAGMVNGVVPHEQLLPRTIDIAEAIASSDPVTTLKVLDLYRDHRGSLDGGPLVREERAHLRWRAGFAPDHVEERRAEVVERGRSQQGETSGN